MRVCGVEIKAREAILAIVEPNDGVGTVVPSKTTRLKLASDDTGAPLKTFVRAVQSYLHENKIDVVVIKERQSGGTRGASGVTFKIEAMFQLSHETVQLVHFNTLNKFSKTNAAGLPEDLPVFQKEAYLAATWYLKDRDQL